MTHKANSTHIWNGPIKDPYAVHLHEQLSNRGYTHSITFKFKGMIFCSDKRDEALSRLHKMLEIFANRLEKRARARRRIAGLPPKEVEFFGSPEVTSKSVGSHCSPHYHCALSLDDTLTESDIAECISFITSHKLNHQQVLDVDLRPTTDNAGWIRYCLKNTHKDNLNLSFVIRPRIQ